MHRRSWKWLLGAVLVVAALVCAVPQADAGWRNCCGGWGGCGWGGCGWGYGYGYGCGGWGCGYAWPYYTTWSAPCSNCGGCYGGCSGYSSGGCSSCGGSLDYGTPAATPTPATPSPTPPQTPSSPPKTTATPAADSVQLTVWVPDDAKITVNGLETRSTGARRSFVSYGLKPNLIYTYVIRAGGSRQPDARGDEIGHGDSRPGRRGGL